MDDLSRRRIQIQFFDTPVGRVPTLSAVEALASAINEVDDDLTRTRSTIDERLTGMQNQLSDQVAKTQESMIKQMKETKANIAEQIEGLGSVFERFSQDIGKTLREKLEEVDSSLSGTNRSLSVLNSYVTELTCLMNNAARDLTTIRTNLDALDDRQSALGSAVDDAVRLIETIKESRAQSRK